MVILIFDGGVFLISLNTFLEVFVFTVTGVNPQPKSTLTVPVDFWVAVFSIAYISSFVNLK